ncbi:MAG TPA: DEAD/DEAH box helicase [Actinomycetota bacterium]|nr:DEAD/DEAH box helicase [Actinomycetota bacterium]
MTASTFAALGVSRSVIRALAARGADVPFPVQAAVLPDALAGRDVLVKSPTGSGKTLAFGVAIAERLSSEASPPAALVLVPTRELALQVREELAPVLAARGLRVAVAYGGVPLREQSRAAARANVVVATPGRLEDLAARRLVDLSQVRILVLDEADRMLDMGFQPQVDRIVRRLPRSRQTIFTSATLDGQVGRLAHAYTRSPRLHEVASETPTVAEADHRFLPVDAHGKVDALVELLAGHRGLALVFVRTKRGADRLARRLVARGVAAEALHGDLAQPARERALARFEAGKVDTLVATDVAARGLDLHRITHVINFDPPDDDKGYVHRVGRTARAGRAGTGVTLVTPEQRGDVGRMAARLDLRESFTEEGMEIPPPRLVFSGSSGRRSMLRKPRRR